MQQSIFQCSLCGGMTPLVQKTDKLADGVHHVYAECQSCKGKTTVFYSNKKIRNWMVKQQNIKPSVKNAKKKRKLAQQIQDEMELLKNQFE